MGAEATVVGRLPRGKDTAFLIDIWSGAFCAWSRRVKIRSRREQIAFQNTQPVIDVFEFEFVVIIGQFLTLSVRVPPTIFGNIQLPRPLNAVLRQLRPAR
jgi:hypothetical protein